MVDLSYSIGIKVAKSGTIKAVSWQGPAFSAGISIGAQINSVNGQSFTPQILLAAVACANTTPLTLGIHQDGKAVTVQIPYRGKLASPHLQPITGAPDRLLPWLAKSRGAAAN